MQVDNLHIWIDDKENPLKDYGEAIVENFVDNTIFDNVEEEKQKKIEEEERLEEEEKKKARANEQRRK